MIVKQYGFEPCGSIYIWILSIVNIIVLHDPLLVEYVNSESWIRKANYKVVIQYFTGWSDVTPTSSIVQVQNQLYLYVR